MFAVSTTGMGHIPFIIIYHAIPQTSDQERDNPKQKKGGGQRLSGRKARKRAKKKISSQDRKRKLKITEVHGRKRTYFLNA